MPVNVNDVSGEVVVTSEPSTALLVQSSAPATLVVQSAGVQGPPGPPGPSGGETYRHVQVAASSAWTVTHNLGRYPAVIVINSANDQVYGDVNYLSLNEVVVSFSAPFSGTAEFV